MKHLNKMNDVKQLKTIVVSEENYEKLKMLGYTSDSFNDVVSRLLDAPHTKEKK